MAGWYSVGTCHVEGSVPFIRVITCRASFCLGEGNSPVKVTRIAEPGGSSANSSPGLGGLLTVASVSGRAHPAARGSALLGVLWRGHV